MKYVCFYHNEKRAIFLKKGLVGGFVGLCAKCGKDFLRTSTRENVKKLKFQRVSVSI